MLMLMLVLGLLLFLGVHSVAVVALRTEPGGLALHGLTGVRAHAYLFGVRPFG